VLRSVTVAAVLAGEGMRVIDLGAGVDASIVRAAIAVHRPDITWIVDGATMEISGYPARTMAEITAYARGLLRGTGTGS
jgi:methanogenic corrinoid protein MtbC1